MSSSQWTHSYRFNVLLTILFLIQSIRFLQADHANKTEKNQFYRIDRIVCANPSPDICAPAMTLCRLQLVNRNTQYASIGCVLARRVDHIHVRIVLYYKYKTYVPYFIDITEDFCSAMRTHARGEKNGHTPLLSTLLKNIIPNSNINHECPYAGNVTTSKLRIGDVLFKDFIPAGKYLLFLRIFEMPTNATILEVRVFFTIPSGKMVETSLQG